MALLPAYRLKLYRNFKAIDGTDYHGMVRYYERFEDDIRSLDFEEYLDCTIAYANALYETGAFGKHNVMADYLLETVIMQNIETWSGEDIYTHLLFKKAASLYRMEEYGKSEHILRELIKLRPWDKLPIRFLKSVRVRQKPVWIPRTRSIALALILLSALLISWEFFVARSFFPEWSGVFEWLRNGTLLAGILTLGGGEVFHAWSCFNKAESFAARFRKKKSAFK